MRRLLAIVVLLAQASAALHLALVAHETSALTGALIEQGDVHRPVEARGTAVDTGCTHDGTHDEERCDAFTFMRTGAVVHAVPTPAAAAEAFTQLPALDEAIASAPLDVLSVAPKSSPPV